MKLKENASARTACIHRTSCSWKLSVQERQGAMSVGDQARQCRRKINAPESGWAAIMLVAIEILACICY